MRYLCMGPFSHSKGSHVPSSGNHMTGLKLAVSLVGRWIKLIPTNLRSIFANDYNLGHVDYLIALCVAFVI